MDVAHSLPSRFFLTQWSVGLAETAPLRSRLGKMRRLLSRARKQAVSGRLATPMAVRKIGVAQVLLLSLFLAEGNVETGGQQ
jgi:hypothetical protein